MSNYTSLYKNKYQPYDSDYKHSSMPSSKSTGKPTGGYEETHNSIYSQDYNKYRMRGTGMLENTNNDLRNRNLEEKRIYRDTQNEHRDFANDRMHEKKRPDHTHLLSRERPTRSHDVHNNDCIDCENDRVRGREHHENKRNDRIHRSPEEKEIIYRDPYKTKYSDEGTPNDHERDRIQRKEYLERQNILNRLLQEKTLEIEKRHQKYGRRDNTITEYSNLLDEALERNKKLMIENAELQNNIQKLKTLEEKYENESKLNSELQKEKDYQAVEIIQLKSEVDNLVKCTVDLELKDEVDRLKMEKEAFIQQIANLESNLHRKQEALYKIQDKYKAIKADNSEFGISNFYKHQYVAQKNQFETLKQQFDERTVAYGDKDVQLELLRKENKELKDEIRNVKLLRFANKNMEPILTTPVTVEEEIVQIEKRKSNEEIRNSDIFPAWWTSHMNRSSPANEVITICPNCCERIAKSALDHHIGVCMDTDAV